MDEASSALAARLSRRLKEASATVAVAESCTGGLLASTLTDISGSSEWFSHGWITYSNKSKIKQLDVDEDLLEKYGSVSVEVAQAMADGAREHADATLGIGITGIAGPKADDSDKPIGQVYVSVATDDGGKRVKKAQFGGNRLENKEAFVAFALRTAITLWDKLRDRDSKIELQREKARKIRESEERERLRLKQMEEAKAQTRAPWQDEVWQPEKEEDLDDGDIEWDASNLEKQDESSEE